MADIETPVAPSEAVVDPGTDFDTMLSEFERADIGEGEGEPTAPAPPAAVPEAPVAPTTAPIVPPKEAVPPVTPPVAPTAVPAPQPQVAVPAAAPQPDARRTAADAEIQKIHELREGVRTEIAKRYTLSEEDKNAWITEPEKGGAEVGGIALYLDVYDAVFANVAAQLPGMIGLVNQQNQRAQQWESGIASQHPGLLEHPEGRNTFGRMFHTYRQLNPKMPHEQLIREVGSMAMATLGIERKAAPANVPPPPQQPVRPFSPAAVGGVGAGNSGHGQEDGNFWSNFAKEIEHAEYGEDS